MSSQINSWVERSVDVLITLGFLIEPLGGGTWILRRVPTVLYDVDLSQLILTLVSELANTGAPTEQPALIRYAINHMAAFMTREKSSVLTEAEVMALLSKVDKANFSGAGSLPYIFISRIELERRFGQP